MAKEKQEAPKQGFVCITPCFFDGRLYAVGDPFQSNKEPPPHFQSAAKPLPEEPLPVNPKKVRRVSPAADMEKGLNGIE